MSSSDQSPWVPAPQLRIELLTRAGCHLCDDARRLLESYGLVVESIDIDADEELRRRYTDCVPVVRIDGVDRFRGRVNEILLRRILKQSRRRSMRRRDSSG